MEAVANLPTGVLVIWWMVLAIVAVVIVPVAVLLLHRTARAAWSIRRYLREMLAAGIGIAGNTGAIARLDETRRTVGTLADTAGRIAGHAHSAATVLGQRAAQGRAA